MPEEPQGIDYEKVLADLYARRDQVNQAIAGIEALTGRVPSSPPVGGGSNGSQAGVGIEGPGALLGLSIVDAAKKLLALKRQPLRNPELATLFKAGGLALNSREPANTIGSVLTRRMTEVGDIVRVERGTWGLKEWYPNRSFGKKVEKGDDSNE
jgi:HB1, ASXL, restriction endonuclease HTH domain